MNNKNCYRILNLLQLREWKSERKKDQKIQGCGCCADFLTVWRLIIDSMINTNSEKIRERSTFIVNCENNVRKRFREQLRLFWLDFKWQWVMKWAFWLCMIIFCREFREEKKVNGNLKLISRQMKARILVKSKVHQLGIDSNVYCITDHLFTYPIVIIAKHWINAG